jgi:hypothetical protein
VRPAVPQHRPTVQSAIRFHIKAFGRESLELENPAVDAFVAEAVV